MAQSPSRLAAAAPRVASAARPGKQYKYDYLLLLTTYYLLLLVWLVLPGQVSSK